MKKNLWVILTGALIGAAAVALSLLGNPANMGFCIACFLRDIAGAVHLHGAEPVQYVRPEIMGIALGAFFMASWKKEFQPTGGSSPVTRFFIGAFVMIGALVFLGCPLRMLIRLGGGDLNALVGLIGFAAGVLLGVAVLNRGFTLGRAYPQEKLEGGAFPAAMAALFIVSLAAPALFGASESGPGAMHAPVLAAFVIALAVGAASQKSRLCMAGGIRDAVLFKDFTLLGGFAAILLTVLALNLILGKCRLGFLEQPIAHTDGVWNFLGMALVGWGSVLLGGCPLRQLVLAGQGNSDSAVTVLGLIAGAAFSHNFALASSANGPTAGGMAATALGLAVLAVISICNRKKV